MKKTLAVAVALLSFSATGAFANSEGPFGLPESGNSFPAGFRDGTVDYMNEQRVAKYFQDQAARIAAAQAAAVQQASNTTRAPANH